MARRKVPCASKPDSSCPGGHRYKNCGKTVKGGGRQCRPKNITSKNVRLPGTMMVVYKKK